MEQITNAVIIIVKIILTGLTASIGWKAGEFLMKNYVKLPYIFKKWKDKWLLRKKNREIKKLPSWDDIMEMIRLEERQSYHPRTGLGLGIIIRPMSCVVTEYIGRRPARELFDSPAQIYTYDEQISSYELKIAALKAIQYAKDYSRLQKILDAQQDIKVDIKVEN